MIGRGDGCGRRPSSRFMLSSPAAQVRPTRVIFSCSDPKSYDHPNRDSYKDLVPASFEETAQARAQGKTHLDMLFDG